MGKEGVGGQSKKWWGVGRIREGNERGQGSGKGEVEMEGTGRR